MGDHYGVHFWKCWGPNGSALQKSKRTISECTHILIQFYALGILMLFNWIRLHFNVVPFAFRSALRYGPFRLLECSPMWSETIFRVHSHLVHISPKWSHPIIWPILNRPCYMIHVKLRSKVKKTLVHRLWIYAHLSMYLKSINVPNIQFLPNIV